MTDNRKKPEVSEKNSNGSGLADPDFKSIRESKGLTLKDIFKITRISMSNLAAIENGEFHLLPPPVFAKSFIKIYAKTLGVDRGPTLARYEQYLETLETSHRDSEIEKIPKPTRSYYGRFLWVSFILIIIVFTIFSLSSYKSETDTLKDTIVEPAQKTYSTKPIDESKTDIKSEISDQTNPAIKSEGVNPQSPPSIQVQRPAKEPENKPDIRQQRATAAQQIISMQNDSPEKHPISIKATELTWLRITAEQDPPYEILLKPGEKIQKTASQFIIDVGNAGGIEIEFQGNSLGNLGKHGEVVHLKLP